ncbi:type II secretion system F family protein [Arthrobacter sp. BL-252-APC-1A]|uniref:type II secretion system F family protein n=1 Tax=Arthrobacter sp. BL-252-APC-1A TaxID=2606622 RepID=UPI0012B376F4|nr:type II secretion system F family protein [Arthrobacter sp. BL-252-APC-1A]MSR99585.1 type II secretion system F family protein [Arthrobacter sp. BL-252-APC-1A]
MSGLAVSILLAGAAAVLWGISGTSVPRAVRHSFTGRHPSDGGARGDAGRGVSDPALMLDLMAAMLTAGRPLPAGMRALSEVAEPGLGRILARVVTALELGAGWHESWELVLRAEESSGRGAAVSVPAAEALQSSLAFAATSGAPSAAVLHAQATQLRRRKAREAERRAASLGVHLVLPLGLCALPSFICLTVVPLLLTLLPSF